MADPAPLVQLQPGGSPAIISYQVPEPTSFSGRNFINLALPKDAFASIENTVSAQEPAGDGVPPGVRTIEALTVPGMVTPDLTGADDATVVATTTAPLTQRLARLTRGEVKAMADNGQRVIIHPTVGGLLDFRVAAAPVTSQTLSAGLAAGTRTSSAAPRVSLRRVDDDPGPDPDPGPKWEPTLTIFLTTPQSGGPPITGPSAGAVVKVTGGWTSRSLTATPTITATLDGQPVGPVAVNVSAQTYSLDILVAQAGGHTLTVTGTASADNSEDQTVQLTSTRTRAITVELSSAAGAPTTPPIVAFTAPKDGTLLLSQEGTAEVTVSGTSAAGTGRTVTKVTVREAAGEYTATPDASGSWSIEIPL
jgi:hypothetical protein